MKKIIRNIKPPLGVRPFQFFKDELYDKQKNIELKEKVKRVEDLRESIIDYATEHRKISEKWIAEYNDIINTLECNDIIEDKLQK